MDNNRISSPVSPLEGGRDSMMSGSTAVGGRLRLADLRREEEERMRTQGRKSMGSEWGGNGGYGGYNDGHFYDHHQGVGQAM